MNRKTIIKLPALIIVDGTLLQACDKDDDASPIPVPDKVKKLAFTWKITAITSPKLTAPYTDSSILKPCTTDDLIKFGNAEFDFQDGANVKGRFFCVWTEQTKRISPGTISLMEIVPNS